MQNVSKFDILQKMMCVCVCVCVHHNNNNNAY